MHSMSLFYNNVALAIFVGTKELISLTAFEYIDESFNFKTYLVPHINHCYYTRGIRHYECIGKIVSNRIINGINNNDVILSESKETK